MKRVFITHGDCPDGLGAELGLRAYAEKEYLDDELIWMRAKHSNFPKAPIELLNTCAGARVVIADFCYNLEVMREIINVAQHVLVLDHHISKKEILETLQIEYPWISDKFDCTFNNNKSGTGIVWYYYFGKIPTLMRYIQDLDLWTFSLPMADKFGWLIDHITQDYFVEEMRKWNDLFDLAFEITPKNEIFVKNEMLYKSLVDYASTTKDILMGQCKKLVAKSFLMKIKGQDIHCLNTSVLHSRALDLLVQKKGPPAASYYFNGTDYLFSVRGDGALELAQRFPGGGGHAKAAGFAISDLKELI